MSNSPNISTLPDNWSSICHKQILLEFITHFYTETR